MSEKGRIAVIGHSGQIGHELLRACSKLGQIVPLDLGDLGLDLSKPATIGPVLDEVNPSIIVNAAAYTAVDRAEEERDLARTINGAAPGVMAEWAAFHRATMVHYSTDYVFDGTATRPYLETDPTSPGNVYGETKLAGERAVAAAGGRHLILRTSWIYGVRGSNFMLTMLRLFREREELRVVADQRGSPTWCNAVAEATADILTGIPHFDVFPSGTYHLTSSGETTWHEFASRILQLDPSPNGRRCKALIPVTTDEFPTPARRPAYSVLDCGLAERTFGVRLEDWGSQLKKVMAELDG